LVCRRTGVWIEARASCESGARIVWTEVKWCIVAEYATGNDSDRNGFYNDSSRSRVYRRRASKPDGFEYWELLLNVDDILIILHEPKVHLTKLNQFYEFNLASVGTPERYLGTNIDRCTIPVDVISLVCSKRSSECEVIVE
jgi:hypothetical protein